MQVSQVLEDCQTLANDIWAAAADAKTYGSACKKLARFSFRIVAVLRVHSEFVHRWDQGTKASIARLQAYLKMGLQLVEDCNRTRRVVVLLCFNKIVEKFKAWAEAVHSALGEMKTWGSIGEDVDEEVRWELEKDIQNLQSQIDSDAFLSGDLECLETFADQLVEVLNAGLDSAPMKAINDLMETIVERAGGKIQPVDVADLQKALQNPEQLAGSRFTRDHVYAMLLAILRHCTHPGQGICLDGIVEVPSCFRCPISLDLMNDPVMLVATGQVYDREMIEEWFGGGHVTCPVTQRRVKDQQLRTVHSLKSDIHEFAMRHSMVLGGQGDDSRHPAASDRPHVPSPDAYAPAARSEGRTSPACSSPPSRRTAPVQRSAATRDGSRSPSPSPSSVGRPTTPGNHAGLLPPTPRSQPARSSPAGEADATGEAAADRRCRTPTTQPARSSPAGDANATGEAAPDRRSRTPSTQPARSSPAGDGNATGETNADRRCRTPGSHPARSSPARDGDATGEAAPDRRCWTSSIWGSLEDQGPHGMPSASSSRATVSVASRSQGGRPGQDGAPGPGSRSPRPANRDRLSRLGTAGLGPFAPHLVLDFSGSASGDAICLVHHIGAIPAAQGMSQEELRWRDWTLARSSPPVASPGGAGSGRSSTPSPRQEDGRDGALPAGNSGGQGPARPFSHCGPQGPTGPGRASPGRDGCGSADGPPPGAPPDRTLVDQSGQAGGAAGDGVEATGSSSSWPAEQPHPVSDDPGDRGPPSAGAPPSGPAGAPGPSALQPAPEATGGMPQPGANRLSTRPSPEGTSGDSWRVTERRGESADRHGSKAHPARRGGGCGMRLPHRQGSPCPEAGAPQPGQGPRARGSRDAGGTPRQAFQGRCHTREATGSGNAACVPSGGSGGAPRRGAGRERGGGRRCEAEGCAQLAFCPFAEASHCGTGSRLVGGTGAGTREVIRKQGRHASGRRGAV